MVKNDGGLVLNPVTMGGTVMAKDPVCGMNVDEKKAAATAVYEGKTYYFCSPGCKATFDKDPGKYARI